MPSAQKPAGAEDAERALARDQPVAADAPAPPNPQPRACIENYPATTAPSISAVVVPAILCKENNAVLDSQLSMTYSCLHNSVYRRSPCLDA